MSNWQGLNRYGAWKPRRDPRWGRPRPFGRRLCALAACLALLGGSIKLLHVATGTLLRQVYPCRYAAQVEAAAAEFALPPALLYAVARTESGFRPDAHSHAGAVGLMQLTPDTFTWAQSRSPEAEAYDADALRDPALNLRYGAMVLSLLWEQFGEPDTALAAYNAGMGRVQGWLADERYSADGRVLHTIPYPETRRYVEKVRQAEGMYKRLYGT